MLHHTLTAVLALLLLVAPAIATAGEPPPPGLLIASVEEQVIMADPITGGMRGHESGPVGWLYPAPGGVLFAPDLVNSTTLVLDLRTRQALEQLQGVTMPIFGGSLDRYVVAARQVLVVSYPERAFIARIEAGLGTPWQTLVTVDDGILFVLERKPEGGACAMVAVDLHNRQVAYRRPLAGDVIRFDLSRAFGLLALAQHESDQVLLADPATLAPVMPLMLSGPPVDLAFVGEEHLVIAVAAGEAGGKLVVIQLKSTRKGLKLKHQLFVPLAARPVRLAVGPWQQRVAVAGNDGTVEVIALEKLQHLASLHLPAAPRDMVWCDPQSRGPLLPEWSDRRADSPPLELGFPVEAEVSTRGR